MATTGQQIANKVETILQDETNVRWSEAEILGWINSGLSEIVTYKPNALVTTAALACAPGTKQTLPAAALMLIDVPRNMGANGTTPGRAITPIARKVLDASNPDWHASTASTTTKHYTFDPKNPKVFYVYPPQPATGMGYLEIAYSATPTPLASLANNIPFDDIYENVLIDYVMYRAYSKDAEHTANMQRAQGHYQAFGNAVGARLKLDFAMTPKMAFDSSQQQPVDQGQ